MADTTWVLCDQAGVPVTEIANAAQRKFTARRNHGRGAEITLAHDDLEAQRLLALLANGTPQLRYIRAGTLRLSAYLTAITESLSDTDDQLVATFKDPFGRLYGDGSEQGRIVGTDVTYTGVDQGQIGWNLINAANSSADTGIRKGNVPATKPRDRSYEAGKNVGEALAQLTEVIDGFDFELLPLDPTVEAGKLGEFVVYARQGIDRPELLWGYGDGTMSNVLAVGRTLTPPVNRVRMITDEALVADVTDETSRGIHGGWDASMPAPSDITVQATLDERARQELRAGWTRVVTFTPDPDLGPQPFADYWLGDTGRFKGNHGAFREIFTPRINAVTITEGADREETHELEVEAV